MKPLGKRERHQGNFVDRNPAGSQTGDDLTQAAGPERPRALIHKLAFMKRSATDHNDKRATGAGLGLRRTPVILLSRWHHGNNFKVEPTNLCLLGLVDMPRSCRAGRQAQQDVSCTVALHLGELYIN